MSRRQPYRVPYIVELAEYLEAGADRDGAGLGPSDALLAARALRTLDRLNGGLGRRRVRKDRYRDNSKPRAGDERPGE